MADVNCIRCPLAASRTQVVLPRGELTPGCTVLVGEAPGASEDIQGRAFVGRSGKLLSRALRELGDPPVYITNAVRCRPPGNRDPHPFEREACAPYLRDDVSKAGKVIALGNVADTALLALDIEHEKVWHPAYVLRNMGRYEEWKNELNSILSTSPE